MASFHALLAVTPQPPRVVHVCDDLACRRHGAAALLAELERRAILNALEYTRGDRAVAAHLLGIGRTTLYRKLKEYEFAC